MISREPHMLVLHQTIRKRVTEGGAQNAGAVTRRCVILMRTSHNASYDPFCLFDVFLFSIAHAHNAFYHACRPNCRHAIASRLIAFFFLLSSCRACHLLMLSWLFDIFFVARSVAMMMPTRRAIDARRCLMRLTPLTPARYFFFESLMRRTLCLRLCRLMSPPLIESHACRC